MPNSHAKRLPFSLVAGTGLGISHSTLPQLGSLSPAATFGQAKLLCAANLTSANLFIQDKIHRFADVGGTIEFAYVYNSQSASPWRLAAGPQLKKINEDYILTEHDGNEVNFIFDMQHNCYYAQNYHNSRQKLIINSDQSLSLYDPLTRTEKVFAANGLLKTSIDNKGNKTQYHYEQQQLKTIIAPSQTCYEFEYGTDEVKVCAHQNNEIIDLHTYHFKNEQLVASTTPDGYAINYQYDEKTGLLDKFTQSDTSTLGFRYLDRKIAAIQVGDNKDNTYTLNYHDQKTELVHPSQTLSTLTFDAAQRPKNFALTNLNFDYEFYPSGQIKKVSYPDKSSKQFEYDSITGLLIKKTKRDGNTIEYVYSDDEKPVLLKKVVYDKGIAHPTYCHFLPAIPRTLIYYKL